MGEVYQASCAQTNINRLDNNSKLLSSFNLMICFQELQVGVKVIIVISLGMVVMVIVYAVLYQLCKKLNRKQTNIDEERNKDDRKYICVLFIIYYPCLVFVS